MKYENFLFLSQNNYLLNVFETVKSDLTERDKFVDLKIMLTDVYNNPMKNKEEVQVKAKIINMLGIKSLYEI